MTNSERFYAFILILGYILCGYILFTYDFKFSIKDVLLYSFCSGTFILMSIVAGVFLITSIPSLNKWMDKL